MSMERVKTEMLHLAYEDSGPKKGEPVLLVHGWPESPRCWDGVLPLLHKAGYRTIAPYLRGYGPTGFRSHLIGRNPRRTGQAVAFAQDVIDLADKLKLTTFDFVGHDWGARTGYALSALFPQRLKSLTALSVPFVPGPMKVTSLPLARALWYQWYLCSHPGARDFARNPIKFARMQWETWSPEGWFTESQFEEAAKSWASEDFIEVTLHAYRSRWGHAPTDPKYDLLNDRYESTLSLPTPTLLIHGLEDRCDLAETTDGAGRSFTGGYRRALLDGVGHFVSREAPRETAQEILSHLAYVREVRA
ncbi:alpha/beta fold hydrolase [Terriglobus saanensis]|nr:alpha/beta hydrolase [Terriglobus saanensis]